jgi:amino acid adenylation domain-containing protein
LPPQSAKFVCLDDATLAEAPDSSAELPTAAADDSAYVIFTSGSTGRPKGVEITHRGAVNFLWAMQRSPGITADDVVLALTTLSFDISVLEIFLPLITGARTVVVPRVTAMDGWALLGELEHRRATLLQATPATWRLLLDTPWKGTPGLKALIGGEACPRELAAQLLSKCGELWNMYGPTETTVWCTLQRLMPDDTEISIGRPIANMRMYILDSYLQPTPIGVPGELHIGGVGLGPGYLNRPALTAEKFIADPFSEVPGARLYATGDLARYTPDGRIECLGRLDHQIKLRGFRIEPGEIEAAVKEQPNIRDAAVVMRDDGTTQRLVAYCVSRDAEAARDEAITQLTTALNARLPGYMVPAVFVFLDALPLTASGKIDRRSLPEPTGETKPTRGYVPPQNSVHAHLIEIWEEVLNRKSIGIRDDFFEIGGHSLLAARVIALTNERLGHRLPFAEFFANPTIEAHTRSLFNSQVAVQQTPYALVNPSGRKTPFFFFHGDFVGGGFFCKTLANRIGADRPFYAIHPHGLQGDEVPLTIEAMAAERLEMIRKIQPHGPYLIGGYCNGSLAAYHVARLLGAAGEEVPVLLMLYSKGTNIYFGFLKRIVGAASAWRGENEMAARQRFLNLRRQVRECTDIVYYYCSAAADLLRRPSREKAIPFLRIAARMIGLKFPALPRKTNGYTPPDAEAALASGAIGKAYADVCLAYIPPQYDAPVILLWPREEKPPTARGPATGWEKVCRNFQVVEVPGHHHSCISQNANVVLVGEAMRKAIDQAESLLTQPLP